MKILDKNGVEHQTVKECMEADALIDKQLAEKEKAEKQKSQAAETAKSAVSKKKKELADKINAAENKVNEASAKYNLAKKEAAEIITKAKAEANKLLTDAKENLDNAYKERWQAIQDFNTEFGAYQVTYTGAKALEEYEKAVTQVFSMWDKFFDWF